MSPEEWLASQQKPAMSPEEWLASQQQASKPSFGEMFKREVFRSVPVQTLAGALGGATEIGTTVFSRPIEGKAKSDERRQEVEKILSNAGVDPSSIPYNIGKIGMQVLGTAGAGPALAKLVTPFASAAAPIVQALRSGGMTAGTGGLGTRVAGGALAGGAQAAMINPEDAATGAVIGGAFPVITKAAGELGGALRRSMASTMPPMTPEKLQTLQNAQKAGYVVPPSQAKPTIANRLIESVGGKQATAQVASTRNQAVTDKLVRDALPGFGMDTPMNFEALSAYRSAQHAAGYEPLRQAGVIPASQKFADQLDNIVKQYVGKGTIPAVNRQEIVNLVQAHRSAGFDAGDAVDAIRILREESGDAFRTGNSAVGKAKRALADAYESAIDDALAQSGQSDLLSAYRQARQNIAKSFTVQDALKEGTGSVDARKLGAALQAGAPMSGELRTAGEFGNAFNKSAQPPELIGSPDTHNLKSLAALATGGAGGVALGPLGVAAAAIPYAAPMAARGYMFSNRAQQSLLTPAQQQNSALVNVLRETLPLTYRAAPVLAAQ